MVEFRIKALDDLIEELAQLPGIGRKTAQRLAIFILKSESGYSTRLSRAIENVQQQTRLCSRCFYISENEICAICSNERRDKTRICVVEDMVDVMAIESSQAYDGLYHVLGGVISPLAGISPDDLKINELLQRVNNEAVEEVLMALNMSTEGEATMIYLSRLLKDKNVELSRIAHGVPMGSHLEFVDQTTIGRAITGRQRL